MILTIDQIRTIVAAGGGVTINGSAFTLNQLKQVAAAAGPANVLVTIKNVGNLTPQNMKNIAALAPGKIVFDLT